MILFALVVLTVLLTCFLVFFLINLNKVNKINASFDSYIKKLIAVISQFRYGNLTSRVEDSDFKPTEELTKIINSALESIEDREKMIREYIIKEKEIMNLKTDFIATLTHDLKVPVIAQDKTFDLLLDNKFGDLSFEQREALQNMKNSNMDLKFLIETLLETYKLEQAKLSLNITYGVNLSSFTKEIVSLIEPIALSYNKKINYFIKVDDDLRADIDTFLLKRVLQNLILNALSYSPAATCVDVSLYSDNVNLKIDVKDYGLGISKEEIKKIFKKYYSGASKYIRSGIGLGLYLSNKIVKLHKGTIEVDSVINKGTTFTISIPLKYNEKIKREVHKK